MKDEMGDRFKRYESTFKTQINRRTYTILRIDGKAFHTYTRGLKRPFDKDLIEDMDATAVALCENIQGAKFAYVQSDEISVLLTDFDQLQTQAWFDGEIQKMASVSASVATAEFNFLRTKRDFYNDTFNMRPEFPTHITLAHFDSRVFQVPTRNEAINYFVWRQKDCSRNSISSVAQTYFSSKELHGQGGADKLQMLAEKGIDWNTFPMGQKYGRVVYREDSDIVMTGTISSRWKACDAWVFGFGEGNPILNIIPVNE